MAEVEVETLRILLTQKQEFEPILAFRRTDWINCGHLTPEDFMHFLKDLDIPARQSDVADHFRFYDYGEDL